MILVALPFVMAGCQAEEETVEFSDACYMKSFTLGSLKRVVASKTSDGKDTIQTTTFAGSLYPMSIDQKTLVIENKDSLPYGTKVNAVLTTASFEGLCFWRHEEQKDEADTIWAAYDSKDSIDFRKTVKLAVVSNKGTSRRIYTVKVNIHQTNGDSVVWENKGPVNEMADLTACRALNVNDRVLVVGQDVAGTMVSLTYQDSAWVRTATDYADVDIAGIQDFRGMLRACAPGLGVLTTTDGITWAESNAPNLDYRFVAASQNRIYGLKGGALYSTTDFVDWQEEHLDADTAMLPKSDVAGISYTQPNGMTRVLLAGTLDTESTVWSKGWSMQSNELATTWCYYTPNAVDKYRLPSLKHLTLLTYDGGVLALGGASHDGKVKPLERLFLSQDNGVTWKYHYEMPVDAALKQQAAMASNITAAKVGDHSLWIFVDNNLWSVRLNREAFEK